jgi:quinol monooxygenase YgiN
MIFIVVKFTIRDHDSDEWLARVGAFTEATRNEPGNLFFDWSRIVDNPNQFVLVEAFASAEAGQTHVNSEHFRTAMAWMPDVIAEAPEIIRVEVPQDGWSRVVELSPREQQA